MVLKIRVIQVDLSILVHVGASGVYEERSYEGLKIFALFVRVYFLEVIFKKQRRL